MNDFDGSKGSTRIWSRVHAGFKYKEEQEEK